jgi:hypothetical protein
VCAPQPENKEDLLSILEPFHISCFTHIHLGLISSEIEGNLVPCINCVSLEALGRSSSKVIGLLLFKVAAFLKGKCALGPFLSVLVIKCPTQMVMC